MAVELNALFTEHVDGHRELFSRLRALEAPLQRAAELMAASLRGGGSVWLAGNGGSAADAQHIAGEMEGRLVDERPARAVHTLGANVSTLTAVGNDYGFEEIFARQVDGFAKPGDLLILISTSGKSPNLMLAAQAASRKGISVIGLLGKGGGPLADLCTLPIVVPSEDTQWIQEAHITLGHILCKLVDRLFPADTDDGE